MGKSVIVMDSKEKEASARKKKLTRKRDRSGEVSVMIELKKRKNEDKLSKGSKSSSHATNGDQMEHMRETRSEKHHYAREKSNDDRFSFERESGRHEHERSEKHSRRTGDKRR